MKYIVLLTVCAASILLAGCSTTAGAGKDLQSAGEAITKTAEEAKK